MYLCYWLPVHCYVSPSTGSLNDVKEWMKSLVIRDMELTNCGSDTLNQMHIAEIDKAISVVKVQQ